MEPTRVMMAVAFALIVLVMTWIVAVYSVNPFLQANLNTLDDTIALYIDTLSSVEEGGVEVPLRKGTIGSVEVSFENKGKVEKGDYEIPADGWYVIVSYRVGDRTVKSPSRIKSYPSSGGYEIAVFSPESVCITKSGASEYARVVRC
jgi:hypothetical protein